MWNGAEVFILVSVHSKLKMNKCGTLQCTSFVWCTTSEQFWKIFVFISILELNICCKQQFICRCIFSCIYKVRDVTKCEFRISNTNSNYIEIGLTKLYKTTFNRTCYHTFQLFLFWFGGRCRGGGRGRCGRCGCKC